MRPSPSPGERGADARGVVAGRRAELGGRRRGGGVAAGGTIIKCPFPLDVLKDTYDHRCY
jgi:hypothetical protein